MKEKQFSKICESDVCRTRRLEIMDDKNQLRIFADGEDGEFQICDARGNRKLVVRVAPDGGAEIQLVGDEQSAGLSLTVSKKGNAVFALHRMDGEPCYTITTDPFGKVSVSEG